MRNVLLFLFLSLSFNSYAMKMDEFYEESKGDLSVLITNPSLGGRVLISSRSDQNGVCRAFGYERAAVGAISFGAKYRGPMVNIDIEGNIRLGEVLTEASGLSVYSIICLNKVSAPKEKTFRIAFPKHNDSWAPYSSKSDQNGVCKSLGFVRAAVGSMIISRRNFEGLMVIAGADGTITSGEVSNGKAGFKVDTLVCINSLP
jgi:hypothetical protein